MNFSLTHEQQDLVDRAEQLAVEFAKRARHHDETATFPAENFATLKEEGFLKLTVPTNMGGYGQWSDNNYLTFYLILEALAAGCASTGQLLQIHGHSVGSISLLASPEQRERIVGDVARRGALVSSGGNILPAIASGRIAQGEGMLRPVDGGFLLSYTSGFASLGPVSDYVMIFALAPGTTTPAQGFTMAVVPRETPGLTFIDTWDVMGLRATVSWSIKLEDVFIPWENIIGEPGDLIQVDPRSFTLGYAANHLGCAKGVVDYVREFLKNNRDLAKDDAIVVNYGAMSSRLQAARASMCYAARLWETGSYETAELASLRALYEAKEVSLAITSTAFDICGTRAARRDVPLERALRDVRMYTLHTRESRLMRVLTEAELGGNFHAKQQFGPKLGRQSWEALGITRPPAPASAHVP
jgi:alkylation response protein AidB-like acyl-CoA dehydrogenase